VGGRNELEEGGRTGGLGGGKEIKEGDENRNHNARAAPDFHFRKGYWSERKVRGRGKAVTWEKGRP